MLESMGYNEDTNDENVQVENAQTPGVEIIKMDEHKPITDSKCKHETLIPDPDDKLGEAVYHGCANPKCGQGFYLK